jgi:hypothetical protein
MPDTVLLKLKTDFICCIFFPHFLFLFRRSSIFVFPPGVFGTYDDGPFTYQTVYKISPLSQELKSIVGANFKAVPDSSTDPGRK